MTRTGLNDLGFLICCKLCTFACISPIIRPPSITPFYNRGLLQQLANSGIFMCYSPLLKFFFEIQIQHGLGVNVDVSITSRTVICVCTNAYLRTFDHVKWKNVCAIMDLLKSELGDRRIRTVSCGDFATKLTVGAYGYYFLAFLYGLWGLLREGGGWFT